LDVIYESLFDNFSDFIFLIKFLAAHCIHGKDNQYEFLARDIKVTVGAYNLSNTHESLKFMVDVETIEVHRHWNPNSASFNADIAMLTLTDDIPFNRFIQPICLIEPGSLVTRIWNGYTVGYGKSEDQTKDHEDVLKYLKIPIQDSNEECFHTNEALLKLSSSQTFCAGNRNGSSVCMGDSGNGLFIKYADTYFLRGIVSASLYTDHSCDVYNFAIFTNVVEFSKWILDRISSPGYEYNYRLEFT